MIEEEKLRLQSMTQALEEDRKKLKAKEDTFNNKIEDEKERLRIEWEKLRLQQEELSKSLANERAELVKVKERQDLEFSEKMKSILEHTENLTLQHSQLNQLKLEQSNRENEITIQLSNLEMARKTFKLDAENEKSEIQRLKSESLKVKGDVDLEKGKIEMEWVKIRAEKEALEKKAKNVEDMWSEVRKLSELAGKFSYFQFTSHCNYEGDWSYHYRNWTVHHLQNCPVTICV
ncbi:hypothetical protein BKA69DRAFT_402753 [Paraphysoderma sedebokerense]|nr:hypothetical protein BKA69DRAFT_402753 [Paraphysoderma sedebokerense]